MFQQNDIISTIAMPICMKLYTVTHCINPTSLSHFICVLLLCPKRSYSFYASHILKNNLNKNYSHFRRKNDKIQREQCPICFSSQTSNYGFTSVNITNFFDSNHQTFSTFKLSYFRRTKYDFLSLDIRTKKKKKKRALSHLKGPYGIPSQRYSK